MKWLMTLTLGGRGEFLGCAGPRFAELSQVLSHLARGRYLGYVEPKVHRRGRWLLPLGLFDAGLRKAWKRDALAALRNPLRLLRPLHLQSIMVIQPIDVGADGGASMCDGCPDMTVHEDRLVWSCRLEERLRYGQWMRMVPAAREAAPAEPAVPAPECAPEREEQPVG